MLSYSDRYDAVPEQILLYTLRSKEDIKNFQLSFMSQKPIFDVNDSEDYFNKFE
jgi:hypothetical protein